MRYPEQKPDAHTCLRLLRPNVGHNSQYVTKQKMVKGVCPSTSCSCIKNRFTHKKDFKSFMTQSQSCIYTGLSVYNAKNKMQKATLLSLQQWHLSKKEVKTAERYLYIVSQPTVLSKQFLSFSLDLFTYVSCMQHLNMYNM